MNMINKVVNLAWVCNDCHIQVHSSDEIQVSDAKVQKKIEKFRAKLNEI